MKKELIAWDIYEIQTEHTPVTGVKFRGRIRKLCLENDINVLVENTEDIEGAVRFAVLHGEDTSLIIDYVQSIIADASIELVREAVKNPVLSKLKVNIQDRYTL